jgi:hypothetical protein
LPKLKSFLVLMTLVAVLAVGVSTANAATLPQPVLGAWKMGATDGFTLKKSGSKVLVSNFKLTIDCEGKSAKATVLGSYPLAVFTRGGYSTWGVGKNKGGEAEPMPVKVKTEGKTYNGTFSMIWNYEDPAHSLLGAHLSYGSCSGDALGAKPK